MIVATTSWTVFRWADSVGGWGRYQIEGAGRRHLNSCHLTRSCHCPSSCFSRSVSAFHSSLFFEEAKKQPGKTKKRKERSSAQQKDGLEWEYRKREKRFKNKKRKKREGGTWYWELTEIAAIQLTSTRFPSMLWQLIDEYKYISNTDLFFIFYFLEWLLPHEPSSFCHPTCFISFFLWYVYLLAWPENTERSRLIDINVEESLHVFQRKPSPS